MSKIELRFQSAGQVQLGMVDGRRQRLAKSQMAGDGGRQRAAGAVRVRVVDATGTEPGDLAIRLDKHVTRVMRAVAALDEHRAAKWPASR